MRTAFFAFVCAASALVTLHFSSGAAMAGGSLFSRHHYPPPAFYVVRPSHSLNPRARRVFRRHCPSGRIYGPRGTYYPKYGHRFYRADW